MSEENLQKELENISNQLQQFEEYSKELQVRLEALNNLLIDLSRSKSTIQNLKDEKNINESLIPLGSNVMIRAKPLEVNKLFYNVGAGVVVLKTTEEVLKDLNEKIEQLEAQSQATIDQLNQVFNQMNILEKKGQAILKEIQGPAKAQYDPKLVS